MTGGARRGANEAVKFVESAVVSVGTVINLSGLDITRLHCFAGVQFFSDAEGIIPVIPSAGIVRIEIQTINTAPVFELAADHTIVASLPTTLTWAANTQAIRAIPIGVIGATHYKLVVTLNER